MINFFKDSVRELKHVVWPTRSETNKYFLVVCVTLILFWLYLFIASLLFSETLFWMKNFLNPSSNVVPPETDVEVESLLDTHMWTTWLEDSEGDTIRVEWEDPLTDSIQSSVESVTPTSIVTDENPVDSGTQTWPAN